MSAALPHDLHTFMAQVTDEMASEYARIYARAVGDPGTAGDEGEENWATLFREWLPPTYHVQTKGRLIGHDGALSPQIDVLVLKPSYPRKLLEKKVWLAAGVAAAFECKTTLTASHVKAVVERCMRFKRLYPERTGSPRRELRSPLTYGLLAHSHSWKGERSDPSGNIHKALEDATPAIPHPRLLLDLLCVADLATWSGSYITTYQAAWNPEGQQYLQHSFGGARGVMSSFLCSAVHGDRQTSEFRPIGALISFLTQKLAFEDPAVRDLADYYRMANLWGAGQGAMRPWPLSVYSDEVRAQILAGKAVNSGAWDEWDIGGF